MLEKIFNILITPFIFLLGVLWAIFAIIFDLFYWPIHFLMIFWGKDDGEY